MAEGPLTGWWKLLSMPCTWQFEIEVCVHETGAENEARYVNDTPTNVW